MSKSSNARRQAVQQMASEAVEANANNTTTPDESNENKPIVQEEVAVDAPKTVYPTTDQMVVAGMSTKSERIRHLHKLGMPTGEIARQETGGLYQHAYNVIKRPLKRPEAAAPAPAPTVEATKVETPASE